MSKIIVIGSGFSGLSAAAYLSAAGHDVHVYEKNTTAGGRAKQLKTDQGYVFDMGPSWYWMPDIFERFFGDFGHAVSDFYTLEHLDPAFEMIFSDKQSMIIPQGFAELCRLFESLETGSSERLKNFMDDAQYKYETGMQNLSYLPGLSVTEFADVTLLKDLFRLQVFSSFSKHVRKYFSHPKLIALMEFPILFLGAMPQETPAMYSLMNYAGLKMGTWYPRGGFGTVVEAAKQLAEERGATFHFNAPVEEIAVKNNLAIGVSVDSKKITCDAVIAAADYQHVESELLPPWYRNYDHTYWEKKTLAPSCLIYYLGISKKLPALQHHTLFFEEDLLQHSKAIYKKPKWPDKPLFYVCCPSRTDESVAPEGHENLFLLMPLACGLNDTSALRERFFLLMMKRLEKLLGSTLRSDINYKQSYCIRDFISDYHAYKGNAYGLANTLQQTATLKPKIRNKKVKNLFYTGQLTVPGPGVPPALISGKIVSEQLLKYLDQRDYEAAI